MADEQLPFADVREEAGGFSIPALKWRELAFVGALRPAGSGVWVRDPARPMPPFRTGGLFPADGRFLVEPLAGGRVLVRRI
jgi:hypothetical protein